MLSVCLGPLDGLGALGGFRIVSKQWTNQCEDCSLKKKAVTAIVGHFSLKGKALTKNEAFIRNCFFNGFKLTDAGIFESNISNEKVTNFKKTLAI